jgi:hypothetical protein
MGETMENLKDALWQDRHLMVALLAAVLILGCIGESPNEQLTITSFTTAEPRLSPTTTVSITSDLPAPTPIAEEDKRAICLEARANRTLYERCKMAASGGLSMPQSELRRCAEIQQHAGAYSELIFHGLQNCAGIPAGSTEGDTTGDALFCKDMGQPDRDQCYLSVRMCDLIGDSGLKNQCLSGLELKKL